MVEIAEVPDSSTVKTAAEKKAEADKAAADAAAVKQAKASCVRFRILGFSVGSECTGYLNLPSTKFSTSKYVQVLWSHFVHTSG
eukprot:SAG31_NODE_404_length_16109_cov_10.686696_1_plen_84_part_00